MKNKSIAKFIAILLAAWSVILAFTCLRHKRINTKLVDAVAEGDAKEIAYCLQQGADPNIDVYQWPFVVNIFPFSNEQDNEHYQQPALLYVMKPQFVLNDIGDTPSAKVLLKGGADPNCVDGDGNTPLMIAAKSGNLELVRLLLKRKVKVNAVNKRGIAAAAYASQKKFEEILRLINSERSK